MLRERWGWYLVVLGIAMLNKETSALLLVPFVVVFFDRLPRRRFLLLAGFQLVIVVVVRGFLLWLFEENTGFDMENHVQQQLSALSEPGYVRGSMPNLLFISGVLLAGIAPFWSKKPLSLRRSLWVVAPFAVLYLIGGSPGEFRVFYELVPIVGGLWTLTIIYGLRSLGVGRRTRPPGEGPRPPGGPTGFR
jgi:hypothetical protein